MATRATITGQADVRAAAMRCRAEARTFQRNMVVGATKGARQLKPAIKAAIPTFMPSGYAPLLARSLSVTTRSSAKGVMIKVLAKGKGELRDLTARNLGSLRHPVHGRWRRTPSGRWVKNPWVQQRVPPGVVDVPFKATEPKIIAAVNDEVGQVARRVEGG